MVDTLVTEKSEWRGESRINALDRKVESRAHKVEDSRLETIERAANSTLANPIIGGADQTCPRCWGHLRGELIQPRLWVYAVPALCQAYQFPHPNFMIYSLYLIPELPEGVDFVSFILSNRKTFKSYVYQINRSLVGNHLSATPLLINLHHQAFRPTPEG